MVGIIVIEGAPFTIRRVPVPPLSNLSVAIVVAKILNLASNSSTVLQIVRVIVRPGLVRGVVLSHLRLQAGRVVLKCRSVNFPIGHFPKQTSRTDIVRIVIESSDNIYTLLLLHGIGT